MFKTQAEVWKHVLEHGEGPSVKRLGEGNADLIGLKNGRLWSYRDNKAAGWTFGDPDYFEPYDTPPKPSLTLEEALKCEWVAIEWLGQTIQELPTNENNFGTITAAIAANVPVREVE